MRSERVQGLLGSSGVELVLLTGLGLKFIMSIRATHTHKQYILTCCLVQDV